MSELIKAHANGQWDILEKAKFISPEQQKANRLRSAEERNRAVLETTGKEPVANKPEDEVSIEHIATDPDEGDDNYRIFQNGKHVGYGTAFNQPFHGGFEGVPDDIRSRAAELMHEHASKLPHRQINKEPTRAQEIATSSDPEFHEQQYLQHSYTGNHKVANAHRALSDEFGGPDQGTMHPDDIAAHQRTIKDFHSGVDRKPKMVSSNPAPKISPKDEPIGYSQARKLKLIKEDMIKAHTNGQWYLAKDNSVKPFGTSVYNSTANLNRKANRTGEERTNVGRNVAVHRYTTSGSSVQAAHEANEAKRQAEKTKASTRSFKDMSPEEQAKLRTQYETKKNEEDYRSC